MATPHPEPPPAFNHEDWEVLMNDFEKAEHQHDEYLHAYKEMTRRQETSTKNLKHIRYCLKQFRGDLKRLEKDQKGVDDEEAAKLRQVEAKMGSVKDKLEEMERELPASNNGLYLSIILGSNLNISLLNPEDRYKYKQEYESFKQTVTLVVLVMFTFAYLLPFRAVDAMCSFLLTWYYCTLTIRESILRVNGSRIKGWWVAHHYISLVICGITLTWRDGECYQTFRWLYILLVSYIGSVQLLQTKYQVGCLRRLHALGQRQSMMDITVEGFSTWMFHGLTFLLPFLIGGYIIQGYCSYVLFKLYFFLGCSEDWQVLALAVLFGAITLGNIFTTGLVVARKFFCRATPSHVHLAATKYGKPKTN